MGTPGGSHSSARAINDSGQIAGRANFDETDDYHAFLYSAGTWTDLGTLGGSRSQAHDINNSGQIIGSSQLSGDTVNHPFLWTPGPSPTMQDLGTPVAASWATAYGLNDAGDVVGWYVDISGQSHGFLWSQGTLQDLSAPGALATDAYSINDAGLVVGRSYRPDGLHMA